MARCVDRKIGLGCDRQRGDREEGDREGLGWIGLRVHWSSSEAFYGMGLGTPYMQNATDKRAPTVAKVSTAPRHTLRHAGQLLSSCHFAPACLLACLAAPGCGLTARSGHTVEVEVEVGRGSRGK